MRYFLIVMVLGMLTSCGGSQAETRTEQASPPPSDDSFREGFIAMCACPTQIDINSVEPPSKATALANCVDEHASTDDLRKWWSEMEGKSPSEKRAMMGQGMERAGLDECELAAAFEQAAQVDQPEPPPAADAPPAEPADPGVRSGEETEE